MAKDETDLDGLLDDSDSFDPYVKKKSRKRKQDDSIDNAESQDQDEEETKGKSRKTPQRLRIRKKRQFSTPTYLNPNSYQLETVINGLKEYYHNNPHFLKNGKTVDQQINEVITACKKGWLCASNDFIQRVQWKTKWNTEALQFRKDYKESYPNAKQIQLQKELKSKSKNKKGIDKDFKSVLQPEEQKIWNEREEWYRSEFEFNNSSDTPLLMQVLVEEITQRRLQRRRLEDPMDDIELQMSESYKRLMNALRALGITREQRESAHMETEGNVATLSKQLQEKLKFMEQMEEKHVLEEQAMQLKHDNMETLKNVKVPDLEEDLRKAHETELLEVVDSIGELTEQDEDNGDQKD